MARPSGHARATLGRGGLSGGHARAVIIQHVLPPRSPVEAVPRRPAFTAAPAGRALAARCARPARLWRKPDPPRVEFESTPATSPAARRAAHLAGLAFGGVVCLRPGARPGRPVAPVSTARVRRRARPVGRERTAVAFTEAWVRGGVRHAPDAPNAISPRPVLDGPRPRPRRSRCERPPGQALRASPAPELSRLCSPRCREPSPDSQPVAHSRPRCDARRVAFEDDLPDWHLPNSSPNPSDREAFWRSGSEPA